jgi:pimeloyl-ACP methyl ester carboxylesterase
MRLAGMALLGGHVSRTPEDGTPIVIGLVDVASSRQMDCFVHGAGGNPSEFRTLVEHLDRKKFQPWLAFYPSGLDVATIARGAARWLDVLAVRDRFERIVIVAHSMGGLVSREVIDDMIERARVAGAAGGASRVRLPGKPHQHPAERPGRLDRECAAGRGSALALAAIARAHAVERLARQRLAPGIGARDAELVERLLRVLVHPRLAERARHRLPVLVDLVVRRKAAALVVQGHALRHGDGLTGGAGPGNPAWARPRTLVCSADEDRPRVLPAA